MDPPPTDRSGSGHTCVRSSSNHFMLGDVVLGAAVRRGFRNEEVTEHLCEASRWFLGNAVPIAVRTSARLAGGSRN